jgi:hypothetical protein
MKKIFNLETLIFLCIWLFLMINGPTKLFRDPGTFFHTKMGEMILVSGHLPQTDIFSFTFQGKPWIAHQWLGECLMAVIHRISGFDSLLLVTATLLAYLFAWISHRLRRSGMHPMLVVLIISLALAASAIHFHVRPHIVSILFMAFLYTRLCDFEGGYLNFPGLLWLIPIFVLWVNIHGGVLGGLGTLSLMIGGWTLARLLKRESPLQGSRQALMMWGFLLLCISTILVNPYGLDLPKTWFSIMNSPTIPKIIQEHQSAFKGEYGWVIFPLGFFFTFCLIGSLPKWPRISWLIPLIWLGLALSRIRNAPFFAISASIALVDLFPHVRWRKWVVGKGSIIFKINSSSESPAHSLWRNAIPILVIVVTLLFQLTSIKIPILGKGWARLDSNYWPVDLLHPLSQIGGHGSGGTPIFNDMLFGGFLIYYTPQLRVFIDDRCELYGDQALLEYANADCLQFENWSNKYGFSLALTQSGSTMDKCLKGAKEWRLVTRSIPAALYEKF